MIGKRNERGMALLTVLLLVSVMAVIAATALDRLTLATRLAGNAVTLGQARAWLGTAELLTTTRLDDMLAANLSQTTLDAGWLGQPRTIALPDGAVVTATLTDGGNCFNLNSLVSEKQPGVYGTRATGVAQFIALMEALGIGQGVAANVAGAAADWIDSDGVAGPSGAEDAAYAGREGGGLAASRPMADKSELRGVAGVTPKLYAKLEPWICALPVTDLSPINVNTLLPTQAPLLTMLAPDQISPGLARAQLSSRPAGGYGSVYRFWNSPMLARLDIPRSVAAQVQVKTDWFDLDARVGSGGLDVSEQALVDARKQPVMIARRQWTSVR